MDDFLPITDEREVHAFLDRIPFRVDRERFTRLVLGFPHRYLQLTPPVEMVAHFALVSAPRPAAPPPRASPATATGWKLVVVAGDRSFLFSRIAGCLSFFGADIVSAEAFSNSEALVLDTFSVSDTQGRFEQPEEGRRFQAFLESVIDRRGRPRARAGGQAAAPCAPRSTSSGTTTPHPAATRPRRLRAGRVRPAARHHPRASPTPAAGSRSRTSRRAAGRIRDTFFLTASGAKLARGAPAGRRAGAGRAGRRLDLARGTNSLAPCATRTRSSSSPAAQGHRRRLRPRLRGAGAKVVFCARDERRRPGAGRARSTRARPRRGGLHPLRRLARRTEVERLDRRDGRALRPPRLPGEQRGLAPAAPAHRRLHPRRVPRPLRAERDEHVRGLPPRPAAPPADARQHHQHVEPGGGDGPAPRHDLRRHQGRDHRLHQGAGRRRGRARRARELDLARATSTRRCGRRPSTPRPIPRSAAPTARPPSSSAAWAPSRRRAGCACSSPRRPPSRPASTTSSPGGAELGYGRKTRIAPDRRFLAPFASPRRRSYDPEGRYSQTSDKNVVSMAAARVVRADRNASQPMILGRPPTPSVVLAWKHHRNCRDRAPATGSVGSVRHA